ncbi:hypothetical protein FACS189460_1840 [Deltaproteobacteria bacterium]|nr:hypothetical protein FACS189460_1840 [Deltaproteobacteria bacterium]
MPIGTTIIQAQVEIDELTQAEATAVLNDLGISLADVFQTVLQATLRQIAEEKRIPALLKVSQSCSHIPNAETRAALEKSFKGEDTYQAKDLTDLFSQLEI